MQPDNIDLSYKILKQSSRLFAIGLVAVLFKPVFGQFIQSLVDYVVAIPILISGIISIRGFYLAIKGSQNGKHNFKKRYFALFGNLFFSLIIVLLIISIATDLKNLMN